MNDVCNQAKKVAKRRPCKPRDEWKRNDVQKTKVPHLFRQHATGEGQMIIHFL